MQVIVVGGGIAGLTMALSLHQGGISVTVYEMVEQVTPLGVGINLQPNAVRELSELGLGEKLAQTGIPIRELCLFNKFGQQVWSEPRGLAAGFKWPQYSIHRGDLQMLLLNAVRERLGADTVRTGCFFTSFKQNNEKVIARFSDRRTGRQVETDEADVLVGADGIHSMVRRQLYPEEGAPHFGGQLMWRAAIEATPFLGGNTMVIVGHFHQRLVAYPISRGMPPGRLLTNWLVQLSVAGGPPPREDWNRKVLKDAFFPAFEYWHFPWLDVPRLLRRTQDVYEFPLVDRHPVSQWSFGRVTLIGDAAHPMQPIGSQAGSQAIVDARALTAALRATQDPVEALQRYDLERRPAMNEVTLRNRSFGPEAALQVVEERAPNGFDNLANVISRNELEMITKSFQAAAGLTPEVVNNRPSYVPLRRSN
jgi:2-polyprenyl-6-methoxyphenol hydroxylase-like FAD-dependent oxidoreductase